MSKIMDSVHLLLRHLLLLGHLDLLGTRLHVLRPPAAAARSAPSLVAGLKDQDRAYR